MKYSYSSYVPYEKTFASPFGSDPTKKINNFFFEINSSVIMDMVKHLAILSYDQAFDARVCKITLEEQYYEGRLFGGGKEKAERILQRESRQFINKIEKMKSELPPGVLIRTEDRIEEGYRKHLLLYIDVKVSVSADYSKKCFAAISDGNIVHDWALYDTFIRTAKAFKERILSTNSELVHTIKDRLGECPVQAVFQKCVAQLYKYERRYDWDPVFFHSLGMMDLNSIEQCYGLAWALAELSPPTKRCYLKVLEENSKKYVYIGKPPKWDLTIPTPTPPTYKAW